MFKDLTIKVRLICIIGLLALIILAIGLMGLRAVDNSNEGMRLVYEEDVIPYSQLCNIDALMLKDQVLTAEALTDMTVSGKNFEIKIDQALVAKNVAKINKNVIEINKLVDAYSAGKLDAEESQMLDTFKAERKSYNEEGIQPTLAALEAGNYLEAKRLMSEKTDPLFSTVNTKLEIMPQVRLTSSKAEFDKSQQNYAKTRNLFLVLIPVALLIAGIFGFILIRNLYRELGGEPRLASQIANTISLGDFTSQIELKHNDDSSMLASMKKMQANLSALINSIKEAADTIGTGAQQISAGNTNLSQRTEEQASSLEETASSMQQMATTVKQNSENANKANTLAGAASEVAVKGGQVVGQVITTMSAINDSSKKIRDIIGVIDGIAFQTNILALNAAVEAARAGEQGRGFAVVAAEVRSLAQRSAAAAKEIKQLIDDSVEKVQGGTHLVGEAGKTMNEIVTSVKHVTDIVSEIAAASQEQSAGIDQVNNAITSMDEVTQQNAALVEEAAAAAETLEAQAHELTESVSQFVLANLNGQRKIDSQSASVHQVNADQQLDLNRLKATKKVEMPRNKASNRNRLKAPKANKEEDWEEF